MFFLLIFFCFISFSENLLITSLSAIQTVSTSETDLNIDYRSAFEFRIYNFSGGPDIN